MEKLKYLYYKAIIREKRLMKGIKSIKNKEYKLDLIKLYILHFDIKGLYDNNVEDIDDLLIDLSKKKYYITYRQDDYLFLKKMNKKDILNSMFYTRREKEALNMVLLTGVYNAGILSDISDEFGLDPLVILYEKTKDDMILSVAYLSKNDIERYEKFYEYIDESWKQKFVDRVHMNCTVDEVLDKYKIFSKKDIIEHYKNRNLTSENVYQIISTNNYERENVSKLIDTLCKEKNPYYLYIILTNIYKLNYFGKEEMNILENALKETKNIEYNLYYEYHKNKNNLIKKFNNKWNLLMFIVNNKDNFVNMYEYSVIVNELESELKKDTSNNFNDDNINNIMFTDSKMDPVKNKVQKIKISVNKVKK